MFTLQYLIVYLKLHMEDEDPTQNLKYNNDH